MENKTTTTVSCIMPTYNRRRFIPFAVELFLAQDYQNKELIVIDDGIDSIKDLIPKKNNIIYRHIGAKRNIGVKRNLACEAARGEFIAHWDDDDWYDYRRLSIQVEKLQNERKIECIGVINPYYVDLNTKRAYHYFRPKNGKWITYLMYRKSLWNRIRFPSVTVGEDVKFLSLVDVSLISIIKNEEIGICTIHNENSSPKRINNQLWKRIPTKKIEKIMNRKWPSTWNNLNKDK